MITKLGPILLLAIGLIGMILTNGDTMDMKGTAFAPCFTNQHGSVLQIGPMFEGKLAPFAPHNTTMFVGTFASGVGIDRKTHPTHGTITGEVENLYGMAFEVQFLDGDELATWNCVRGDNKSISCMWLLADRTVPAWSSTRIGQDTFVHSACPGQE